MQQKKFLKKKKKKKKSNKKRTFNLENNYIKKFLSIFGNLYSKYVFFIIINDYLEFKLILSTP